MAKILVVITVLRDIILILEAHVLLVGQVNIANRDCVITPTPLLDVKSAH
jgi:hypothetical protein